MPAQLDSLLVEVGEMKLLNCQLGKHGGNVCFSSLSVYKDGPLVKG